MSLCPPRGSVACSCMRCKGNCQGMLASLCGPHMSVVPLLLVQMIMAVKYSQQLALRMTPVMLLNELQAVLLLAIDVTCRSAQPGTSDPVSLDHMIRWTLVTGRGCTGLGPWRTGKTAALFRGRAWASKPKGFTSQRRSSRRDQH